MAGRYCKIILNGGFAAASAAVETVLLDLEKTGSELISERQCANLIQRLADIDLAAYHGAPPPPGGLVGIMKELVTAGVFTDEIWGIFTEPVS